MKNCSDCGQPFEDQYRFCPDDGALLIVPASEGSAFVESTEQPTISEVISGAAPIQSSASMNSGGLAYASARPQVLRCPGCGSEYPRSFSSCPIDGFTLTRPVEPASTPIDSVPVVNIEKPGELDASTAPGRQTQPLEAPLADDSSSLETGRAPDSPKAASRDAAPVYRESQSREGSSSTLNLLGKAPRRAFSVPLVAGEPATERRRSYFPRALIVILAGLLAFAGLYLLLKDSGGGESSTKARTASAVEGQENARDETSFITTPEAARDYEEPAEEQKAENETAQDGEANSDNESGATSAVPAPAPGGNAKRAEAPGAHESQPDRSPSRPPAPPGPTPAQIAAARMNEVARQASDSRVNARLTRVRARKTAAGYRYDLTFTLNSQSQLSLYWDKLLISTRSARGTNNSMVVPFSHNLGASGSMTFTISVEMRGADEADWQGRITCTSLGRDASGRLTRAAFATSVTPG